MTAVDVLPAVLAGVALALAVLIAVRTDLTHAAAGKVLAFVALFLLPAFALYGGFEQHMERAQSTQFCLSCHVMNEHGRSLYVDDPSYVPAAHFQNNRVPRDRACYTCHTDYAMFGGVRAKLRGVRHLYVQYFGRIPAPDHIKLYTPYNNRECLHCHDGARKFEQMAAHNRTPVMLPEIKTGRLSCMASRCHDTVHDVGSLREATFWKESK